MMSRHSDEIAKRKNFQSQFEGHFLTPLFPGLEDMPPPFATQAPQIFDHNLPKVGKFLTISILQVLIQVLTFKIFAFQFSALFRGFRYIN